MSAPVPGTAMIDVSPSVAGTNYTSAFTMPAGSDLGMRVDVMNYTGLAVAPGGVTFNGDAMTYLGNALIGVYCRVDSWWLTNPDVGLHDIVVDMGGNGPAILLFIAATPFEDVDQAAPYNAVETAQWDGSTFVPSFDITDDHSAVGTLESAVALAVCAGPPVLVSGDNETYQDADGGSFTLAGSHDPGAVNKVMSWTASPDAAWALIAMSLNPVGVVTAAKGPMLKSGTLGKDLMRGLVN